MLYYLIAVLVLLVFYYWTKKDPYEHIPGPRGLPFFGNMFAVDLKDLGKSVHEIAVKHNWSLFKLKLGPSKPLIIINDPVYVKQLFNDLDNFDRSDVHDNLHLLHGGPQCTYQ